MALALLKKKPELRQTRWLTKEGNKFVLKMIILKNTEKYFRFQPCSQSWVAIHPNPKGVIQFVGSFFLFGALPTVFYAALLRNLYQKRYTIIAYPSSVIPPLRWKTKLVDHWKASIQLLQEEYAIKAELISYLLNYTNQDSLDVYLDQSNYFWLGHSLGCKYISLLEILSSDSQSIKDNLRKCGFTKEEFEIIEEDIRTIESERVNNDLNIQCLLEKKGIPRNISSKKAITDQPSIFLAPEIYGTEQRNGKPSSAIPFFNLFPSGERTLCLIDKSQNFFGLTALISFSNDKISEDDVRELAIKLSCRANNFICQVFEGYNLKIERLSSLFSHLKPLSNTNKFLVDCIDQIFDELKQRISQLYKAQDIQCQASCNYSSIKSKDT